MKGYALLFACVTEILMFLCYLGYLFPYSSGLHFFKQHKQQALWQWTMRDLHNPEDPIYQEAISALENHCTVSMLLEFLKSPHAHIRKAAKIILQKKEKELLTDINSKEVKVSTQAMFALGEIGDAKFISILTPFLKNSEANTRKAAVDALSKIDPSNAQVHFSIANLHQSASVQLRRQAIQKLKSTKTNVDVIPFLLTALKDKDTMVRQEAMKGLGKKKGHAKVIKALIPLLKGKKQGLSLSSAKILGNLGAVEAIPDLISLFKKNKKNITKVALEALTKIGKPSVKPLSNALGQTKNAYERQQIIQALGEIGDPAAIPIIIPSLKLDTYSKQIAVNALAKIGDPSVTPNLIDALADSNYKTRSDAKKTLIKFGKAAAPAVIAALKKAPSIIVRREAAEILKKMKEPKAVPALVASLKEKDRNLHRAVLSALKTLDSENMELYRNLSSLKQSSVAQRKRSVLYIASVDNPLCLPALKEVVAKDTDDRVRLVAIEGLMKIQSPQIVPSLIQALKDFNKHIGQTAARALANIGRCKEKVVLKYKDLLDLQNNTKWQKTLNLFLQEYLEGEEQKALERLESYTGEGWDKLASSYLLNGIKLSTLKAVTKKIKKKRKRKLYYGKTMYLYGLRLLIDQEKAKAKKMFARCAKMKLYGMPEHYISILLLRTLNK